MEPKEKDLLLRAFEYARENNVMLKKMRSGKRWTSFFRVVYWIAIIIGSIWFYYFIEPYITQLLELYNSLPFAKLNPSSGQ
ncbi:MAG: hypothetical protein AAB534_00395 [Patescibacteria group bacterium]